MTDHRPLNEDGFFSNTNTLIAVWAVTFVLFVCTPLCLNRYRRLLWWRRLRYWRWDVHVEPERDWYRLTLERYDAYRARALELENEGRGRLSREEEEEVRQLFLLDRMAGYTTTVAADDIKETNDDKTNPQRVEDEDANVNVADVERPQSDVDEDVKEPIRAEDDEKDDYEDDGDRIKEVDFSMMNETTSHILVPAAGASMAYEGPRRDVPNGCAICLCEFVEGDRVTWASNKECPHVFHEDCILRWMLSAGRKHCARNQSLGLDDANTDPVAAATNFPMLCPCCRQTFVADSPVLSQDNQEESAPSVQDSDMSDSEHSSNESSSNSSRDTEASV